MFKANGNGGKMSNVERPKYPSWYVGITSILLVELSLFRPVQ